MNTRRHFLGTAFGAALAARAAAQQAPPPSSPPKLKVTDIQTYVMKTGQVFTEVFTDGGITGFGECSPMTHGSAFAAIIDKAVKPYAVGQNPFDVEKIWRAAYFGKYKLGPMGIYLEAMAGVDIALWDIMGKALGVPCYMLLGGKVRDKVPLYASFMRHHRKPAEEVKEIEKWVAKGFKAAKIHPYDYWGFDQGYDDTLDVVKEVRAAFGDKLALLVDVNNSYSVHRAVEIGRQLEKFNVALFEEPIAAYDYAGYKRLCAEIEIAVGAGEQEYTHWQHKDLILQGEVDVIQPDVIKCGGLTELRKIGTIASVFNRPIRCHNTQPTVGTAAHYHFWISDPMCLYEQEYQAEVYALRDKTPILKEPLDIRGGFLTMPDRPGLGIEIDRKVLKEQMA